MRSIESEGDSIDEAIDKALRALEVDRDRAEIEILTDATRGLFGFGGKKARVRATVRAPISAAAVVGQRRAAPEEAQERVPRETGSQQEVPARQPGADRQPKDGAEASRRDEASAPSAETIERSVAVLQGILTRLGVPAGIVVRPAEPGVLVLEAKGDGSGLLIGRRGQTLDALEYLVNRIIARDTEGAGAGGRIVLDVEGYRERRGQYLAALAQRLAEKAKASGRVVTLNPMSPRDRRIVHVTLQADATVVTRSQGEGYLRRVLIVPADKVRRERGPSRSGL
jgi:spoIIIJ-associated protein